MDLDTGNNARLSYRLQGSTAFRISPNTGWIYLAQVLDRESVDRYALTVLATDNGSPAATASASVLVSVLDDNDNEPRFEKDFYAFDLLENLPSDTIVGSVSATDSDLGKNALLRYAIVQVNSSFTVDPDTGKEKYLFIFLFIFFCFFSFDFLLEFQKEKGSICHICDSYLNHKSLVRLHGLNFLSLGSCEWNTYTSPLFRKFIANWILLSEPLPHSHRRIALRFLKILKGEYKKVSLTKK